jgi:hypothetical protein
MAVIDLDDSGIIAAIAKSREAKAEQWDSIGLSMSELGSECDRSIWYSFRWASQPERLTGQKLRLFETGHIEESRMVAELRAVPGVEVQDLDPDTGKQHKVYAIGGHLRGKLDGLVQGIPDAPVTVHVLECKSHNKKSFAELEKKKLKAAKIAHWWQCQFYMHLKELKRCLYLAICKDTDHHYAERVAYDPVAVLQMLVRLERVISANEAPPQIKDSADKWPCLICKHKEVCHKQELGRKHCRTCVRSTPIIDHCDTAAPWLCEKHGTIRTPDEQRAGCGAHLYLPDVVNGIQSDSGDDFIVYDMPDGTQWVNQEQKPVPRVRYWWFPVTSKLLETDDGDGVAGAEELTAEDYADAVAHFASVQS